MAIKANIQKYAALKDHFDKLISGGYTSNGKMDPIRVSYKMAFRRRIGMLDICSTPLEVTSNPLARVITLVGPFDEEGEYPTGIIMDYTGDICCVNHFTDFMYNGVPYKLQRSYINEVYNVISTVISMDNLYGKDDSDAIYNPFIALLHLYPFYLTYHHALKFDFLSNQEVSDLLDHIVMRDILYDEEQRDVLSKSLAMNEYFTEPLWIYNVMTCGGTLDVFC